MFDCLWLWISVFLVKFVVFLRFDLLLGLCVFRWLLLFCFIYFVLIYCCVVAFWLVLELSWCFGFRCCFCFSLTFTSGWWIWFVGVKDWCLSRFLLVVIGDLIIVNSVVIEFLFLFLCFCLLLIILMCFCLLKIVVGLYWYWLLRFGCFAWIVCYGWFCLLSLRWFVCGLGFRLLRSVFVLC